MSYYYLIIPCLCAFFCVLTGSFYRIYIPASLTLLIIEGVLSISTDVLSFRYPVKSDEMHNVFLIVDSALLLFASYSLLPAHFRRIFYPTAFVLFGISLYYSFYKIGFNHFANYSLVVSSFLVTVNYLLVLYFSELDTRQTRKAPVRIICLALLIYHCGTFAFFSALHYLMNDRIPIIVIDINTTLDSIKYVLLGVGFYLFAYYELKKKKTSING